MNSSTTIQRWKIHVLFASLFLISVMAGALLGFGKQEPIIEAIWDSVRAIKPMEAILFIAFWYQATKERPYRTEDSAIIHLKLG